MSSLVYRWRAYCQTDGTFEVVQQQVPTVCPINSSHTVSSQTQMDTVPPAYTSGLTVLPSISLSNGSFSGMYSELLGRPINTVYNGTTQISNCILWGGTATTVSGGTVTFYPTQDGTGATAPLFQKILHCGASAWSSTPYVISGRSMNTSSIVFNVSMGTTIVVGGASLSAAPAGVAVTCHILGY